jgi:hypothetical protein
VLSDGKLLLQRVSTWSKAWLLITCLIGHFAIGCSPRSPTAIHVDAGPPEFVEDSFEALYPVFLLRKIAPGPKAALWTRYYHRWVRWTGKLISFTVNGATFKHLDSTLTFDVSLYVEPGARARLHRYKIGDDVTYVGQLDSYDDVFRTLYLIHGDVVPPPVVESPRPTP